MQYFMCALAAGLVIVSGCSSQKVDAVSNVAPAVKVEQAPDPNLITVDKPERFPLVTATSRAEVSELIANGSVAPDVSRTVPVNALSSGRVIEIHARLGDDVQKGQLLLTINSSDMSQAFSDYKKFQADEALAKTQSERAQFCLPTARWPRKTWRSPWRPTKRPRWTRKPPWITSAFWEEIRSTPPL